MIDFLFLYEHRARELENCVYLATALKNKGYKVKIASMLSFEKKIFKPNVIVTPHLYDENQLRYYISSCWSGRKIKVISMQYEQVLNEYGRKTEIHRPKGEAKKAFHVAWGDNEVKEYLNNGILLSHILKVGSVSMDFNTRQYQKYLYSKRDLAKKYGIPEEKKWCIFFSSFTYCGRSDESIEKRSFKDYAFRMKKIMEDSQPIILDWFEREINDNAYVIFIYRKHPAETLGLHINTLKNRYPDKFYCIDDFSVRHWINVSDICLTWFSTTSLDIYFAEKPCLILRPVPIDSDLELETMYNIQKIQSYNEFHRSLNQDGYIQEDFKRCIPNFICNKINQLVIDDYIDAFIQVAKSNDEGAIFVTTQDTLRNRMVENIMGVLCDICKYIKIASFVSLFSAKIGKTLEYYQQEVYGIRREKERISKQISQLIIAHYSKE